MTRLSSRIEDRKPRYDVVVIGSGYGGAIAASRMARAGRSVCVLERGKELRPGEYPNTLPEALEEMQVDDPVSHEGSRTGLYDLRSNEQVNALVGCGLGGTSLINANVALAPEPRVFDDPAWPPELRADVAAGLEQGFTRARETLKPEPYPDPPSLAKLKALETSAAALDGDHFYRPPINVTFEDGDNVFGEPQRECVRCGDCVSGCNYWAKNTVLMNYLPDARNRGAEIFTRTAVRHVERTADGWAVHYQQLDTGREAFDAPTDFVEADVVVLAAGTLGSTEILLRSKQNGLTVSDQLGRRFSGNGDVLAFAYNGDREVNGIGFGAHAPDHREPVGPCITGIIDLREQPDLRSGLVIEEGAVPGGIGGVMPELLAAAASLEGADGIVARLRTTMRQYVSLLDGPYHGAVHNTQTFLAMSYDDGDGELALDGDRLRIRWPGAGDEATIRAVGDKLRAASSAIGAEYVCDPLWTKLLGDSLITVHPLGGCAMGADAASGAVDHKGRVFSGPAGTDTHPGLYVCDGAVIPMPLAVNPLLTISALAERCCALLAADRGWQIDYTPGSKPPPAAPPPTPGIEFTERMHGWFSETVKDDFARGAQAGEAEGSSIEFVVTIAADDVDDFVKNDQHEAPMAGTVKAPKLSPQPLTITDGRFNLFTQDPQHVNTLNMRYRMRLTVEDGRSYWFEGFKVINDNRGLDVWADTTTLYVTVHDGPDATSPVLGKGIMRIDPIDFMRQLTTMRATGADGLEQQLKTKVEFGRFFAGTLFDVYGGVFSGNSHIDPGAKPRKRRQLRVTAPEVHLVKTDDGVPLRLTRFRGGDKGPVLLVHGLGVSSLIFTIDTIDTNLLEFLFAHGYDVWLLDFRASIELPSSRTQFNGDDVATKDFPAAVRAVLDKTGAASLQVVSHCFGATTFTCAMLAGLTGVRSAVISQISTDVVGPTVTRIKAGLHLPAVLDDVGVDELDAHVDRHEGWRSKLFDLAAKLTPAEGKELCDSAVCNRISFMYAPLYRHEQLNQATHDALNEMFGVANIESFKHLAEMVRKEHVVGADGSERYLPHVERMAIPISFIHGAQNECYLTASIDRTVDRLSKANGAHLYTRHEIPAYGHIDCIFGRDAARDVYPHIVEHLERTAT